MRGKLLLLVFLLAFAVPMNAGQISLSSGASNATAVLGVAYSNVNFDGWNIHLIFGDSNSPSMQPYGIDLTSLTATCVRGGCTSDQLTIGLSDTGFTDYAPTLTTTYSSTQTGVGAGTAQWAFYDTSNTLFGESSFIGEIGPFFGPGGFSGSAMSPGPGGSTPYSLTIYQGFISGGHPASFSADGSITATPEPMSMLLMGTFFSLAGGLLSKKKRA